jgi:hypothetical protein
MGESSKKGTFPWLPPCELRELRDTCGSVDKERICSPPECDEVKVTPRTELSILEWLFPSYDEFKRSMMLCFVNLYAVARLGQTMYFVIFLKTAAYE